MQIRNNYIPLSKVRYCHDEQTVQEAMDFLESVGYRCVPVLNRSTKAYVGNIYLSKIYRYILKNEGNRDDPIKNLIEDSNVYIHEEEPFINAFFNIREFPFLPVISDDKTLSGILTHSKVIDVLQSSWGMHEGGYTITVVSSDYHGALKRFVSIVTQHANIEGLLTLDDEARLFRRLIVTLSSNIDRKKVDHITHNLEKNGFRILSVQQIDDTNMEKSSS